MSDSAPAAPASLASIADVIARLRAVVNLVGDWSINSARDLAWTNSLLLWQIRDVPVARGLLCDSLAATTAMASRALLVPV